MPKKLLGVFKPDTLGRLASRNKVAHVVNSLYILKILFLIPVSTSRQMRKVTYKLNT